MPPPPESSPELEVQQDGEDRRPSQEDHRPIPEDRRPGLDDRGPGLEDHRPGPAVETEM